MNQYWIQHERKCEAFRQKWKGRIVSALDKQLNDFLYDYQRGYTNFGHFLFGDNATVLHDLYRDVGAAFARGEYKKLRAELRRGKGVSVRGHSQSSNNKTFSGVYTTTGNRPENVRLKFRGIGFNTDWAQQVIAILGERALLMAKALSDTTREKVVKLMQQAQEQNLSIDQTVALIRKEVPEFNRRRAETIVRTEVGSAASKGKRLAAESMDVAMEKGWIDANDARERPSHKVCGRSGFIDMDAAYPNGLQHPHDPNGPAGEVINCRCTEIYKVKRDAQDRPINKPRALINPVTSSIISSTVSGLLSGLILEGLTE